MRNPISIIGVFAVACLLTACGGEAVSDDGGGDPGAAAPSGKAAAVKQSLLKLFDLAQAEKCEEAAAYVVYSGRADEKRRWKDTSNYANLVEKAQVDAICGRLRNALKSGPPTFKSFQSETESEGEWLIWTVVFGSGIEELEMHIACLAVDGGYAVGDID